MEAIETTVCREFGTDGVFYGVITAVHGPKGEEVLYQVEYSDGDVEDMDLQEYNYAYALWLKEEGWNGEEYAPNDEVEATTTKRVPKQKTSDVSEATTTKRVPSKNVRGKAAVNKRAKLKEVVGLTSKDTKRLQQ